MPRLQRLTSLFWKTHTREQELTLENLSNFWLSSTEAKSFLKTLGLQDQKFSPEFVQAFAHKSFINELGTQRILSYERAEFFGDGLIGLFVARELFQRFPELNEGGLSKLKGALVNQQRLAQMARALGMDELILMGKGELSSEGNLRDSLLCDLFESFFGTLYIETNEALSLKVWLKAIELYETQEKTSYFSSEFLNSYDQKTQLQEMAMAIFKEHPTYDLKEEEGVFQATTYIQGKAFACGRGASKRKAQEEAATLTLKLIKQQSL